MKLHEIMSSVDSDDNKNYEKLKKTRSSRCRKTYEDFDCSDNSALEQSRKPLGIPIYYLKAEQIFLLHIDIVISFTELLPIYLL